MGNKQSDQLTPANTVSDDALNAMGDGFMELDANFTVCKVNRLYEAASSLSGRESIGKNVWELFPGFDSPQYPYLNQYNKVMETQKPAHFELFDETMSRWNEFDVYPRKRGGVLVFFRDVTDRKNAELELAKQHALVNAITHNVSVGLLMLDAETKVLYMNQVAEQITGYTLEEAKGLSVHELIHYNYPDGTPYPEVECLNLQKKAARFNKNKKTIIEDVYYRKDGTAFTGIANVMTVENAENGKMLVVDLRDTSQEKRLLTRVKKVEHRQVQLESITKSLQKQRRDLIALNTAKDEFINLASHQLRTPATAVKQYLGMVLHGYAGDINEETRKFITTAYEANDRQIQIVESLLQIARMDSGVVELHKTTVDLSPLVMQIVKEQTPTAITNGVLIIVKGIELDIKVAADENMLRMLIENLVDNACKYSRPGKRVYISLSQESDSVLIVVSDEGLGIHKKDQAKLFKKFARLDNDISIETPGAGLGLYWCKRITDMHQGKIRVSSAIGKGTAFTVSLPR